MATLQGLISTLQNQFAALQAQVAALGAPPVLPTLTIGNVSTSEGNSGTKNFNFTVSLSAVSTEVVGVSYATANNTATTADNDYVALTGAHFFLPGETSKTIAVVVNADLVDEGSESFFVNLTSPVNATIADAQGLGTITNDDLATISINNPVGLEPDTGTVNAVFTVTLARVSTRTITVTMPPRALRLFQRPPVSTTRPSPAR